MKRRYRTFLRNTAGKNESGRQMVSLPQNIWESMGWKINDNLQIDIIKSGMIHSINIIKEEE